MHKHNSLMGNEGKEKAAWIAVDVQTYKVKCVHLCVWKSKIYRHVFGIHD